MTTFSKQHLSRYAQLIADQAFAVLQPTAEPWVRRADGLPIENFQSAGLLLIQDEITDDQAMHLTEAIEQLAAQVIIQESDDVRINDGLGHSRPVYMPLVVNVLQSAYLRHRLAMPMMYERRCREALGSILYRLELPMIFETPDTAVVLFRALCWLRHDLTIQDDDETHSTEALVDMIVDTPGKDGAMHSFKESEQLLDTWWYHELVGLHVLTNLAVLTGNARWLERVREIAGHHMENIQADHVTSRPWGMAGFVLNPETTIFAEQQLHEAATGMLSPYAQSNTVTGLLMADAAHTLQMAINADA